MVGEKKIGEKFRREKFSHLQKLKSLPWKKSSIRYEMFTYKHIETIEYAKKLPTF